MLGMKILLHSGEYFYFEEPEKCSFQITDIAHSLSNLCRYGGHCPEFYSVAQHSIYVSYLVPEELHLTALLHDAVEAFIGDMTKPLKELLPDYKILEARIEKAISECYNLVYPLPDEVKQADAKMLVTEQKHLLFNKDPWFGTLGQEPLPRFPGELKPPALAKASFLSHYWDYI